MKKFLGIVLSLAMILSNITFSMTTDKSFAEEPTTSKVIYLDGDSGNDSNDGSTKEKAVQSLVKALELAGDNDTIKVYALAEKENLNINKKVNVIIEKDISIDGSGKLHGMWISNKATIRCAEGKSLELKNYSDYAMKVTDGARIEDGNYKFSAKNTKDSSNYSQGLLMVGESYVKGTSKEKLTIVSDGGYAPNFIQSVDNKNPKFENCNVEFISESTKGIGSGFGGLFGAWVDGTHGRLEAINSTITIKGIGGGLYLSPQLKNSTLNIDKFKKNIKTACNIAKESKIENSTININTGWLTGISVSPNVKLNIENSTINFNNGGIGGLNVAGGEVIVNNSNLLAGTNPPDALIGTGIESGSNSSLIIEGASYIDTSKPLGGAISNGKPYRVTSGLFSINPSTIFDKSGEKKGNVNPIPVDSSNNPLSLFSLKVDKKNSTLNVGYNYEIPDISTVGKYLWLPERIVTFNINNEDTNYGASGAAEFSDESKADKKFHAINNQPMSLVASWNGVEQKIPTPTAIGYKFLGWFDDNNNKYDENNPVNGNITLKAHWEKDSSSYGVQYINNINIKDSSKDDISINVEGKSENRQEDVKTFDEIKNMNTNFAMLGYKFVSWNTKADGSGTSYKPGDSIKVPQDESIVKLYAQYQPQYVTIKFDANGGSFKEGTIFYNDKVFELNKEKNIATLKGEILEGTKLIDAIKTLDPNIRTLPEELQSESSSLKDKFTPPNDEEMPVSSSFWFFTEKYAWYNTKLGPTSTDYKNKDKIATIDGNTILRKEKTYYLAWKLKDNVKSIENNTSIEAKIYVNKGDEEPTLVYKNKNFSITAKLNITNVKKQMEDFEGSFGINNNAIDNINLSGLNTKFTGVLTVPEGIIIPSISKKDIDTNGFNDLYEIDQVRTEGNKIYVDMSLKGEKDITKYSDLKEKVMKSGFNEDGKSYLSLSIKGFKVEEDKYKENKKFQFGGEFNGNLSSFATLNDNKKYFNLSWNANNLSSSVITPKYFVTANDKVYGDILIGDNTEHDAYYPVKKDENITYTGRLFLQKVKEKITSMKKSYNNGNTENILLKNVQSKFIAKIVLGEGLEIESISPMLSENPVFKIDTKNVEYNSNSRTITIPMILKKDYTSFNQLYDDVIKIGGSDKSPFIDIRLPGVKVTAQSGTQSIKGDVNGEFEAIAYIKNNQESSKYYEFKWVAEQNFDNEAQVGENNGVSIFAPNGQDYKLKDTNSREIQFTTEISGTDPNSDKKKPKKKDRIDTAIEISKKYYGKSNIVIVCRHDLYPDSLTATVLSKQLDAPILLTHVNKLDERVKDEISRLGATHVIIVGGPKSVSEYVKEEIRELFDKNVERISGTDRYGTSEMVARRVVGLTGVLHKAVVASGEVFPDALSVSPFAAHNGYPILLIRYNQIPKEIRSAIKDLKIDKTYVIGGDNTISKNIYKKLPTPIERMAGIDRYETAIKIAESKFKDATKAFVASGEVFSDALVIGPVAGKYNDPVILVKKNPPLKIVKDYIQKSRLRNLEFVGGEKTITPAARKYFEAN